VSRLALLLVAALAALAISPAQATATKCLLADPSDGSTYRVLRSRAGRGQHPAAVLRRENE